jgi:hypothetical protein
MVATATDVYGSDISKPCPFDGCGGTMTLRPGLKEAATPHTLEWPWRATWVCGTNASHFEIATPADERRATKRR